MSPTRVSKYLMVGLLFLLMSPAVFPQDSITVKEVPADLLFKNVNQYGFAISPDGKYFAEVVTNNIESEIVVLDIDGYVVYNQIPIGRRTIDDLHWLSNKRLLYESYGAIYAIDIDGNNSKQIVDRTADVQSKRRRSYWDNFRINRLISTLPSKKHQVLIETYDLEFNASIKEVNIFTGKKYTVINGNLHNMNQWVLDSQGKVRMGLRYTDDGFNYLVRKGETDKWEQCYINIDGKKYPLSVKARTFLNQNLTFEGFAYDPDIIYLTTNIGSDKRKLVSYSLSNEEVREVLVEDINCDVKEPDDDVFGIIFDNVNEEIAGVRYESIVPEYNWISPKYKEFHDKLNSKFPRFINDLVDVDATGNRFVIHQWSDIYAGNIGIYDVTDDSYAVMFQYNAELNDFRLSKTKIVMADAEDSYKIPCYLNLPVDYDKKESVPLVVIPHGGPWVRDYWRLDEFAQYFASRGYATVRVNFRGSTGFGKNHVLSGVNNIDGTMINDIADSARHIMENFNIDKDKVFIYGHSYGGYATYMSLIKFPSLYTAGVAVSAPTDIRAWMKLQKEKDNNFSYEFWNMALGNRKSKFLDEISPLSNAAELNKPVLIFHGEYDRIIPVEQSKVMVQALRKKGKNVRYEELQKEGHSINDSYSMSYILDESHAFFQGISNEE